MYWYSDVIYQYVLINSEILIDYPDILIVCPGVLMNVLIVCPGVLVNVLIVCPNVLINVLIVCSII